jgi:hypothetical protein
MNILNHCNYRMLIFIFWPFDISEIFHEFILYTSIADYQLCIFCQNSINLTNEISLRILIVEHIGIYAKITGINVE